jgi:hypothetical protein
MKINKKISLQKFLPLSEVEIQGLLQLKPVLDIFLRGSSLFSCPQQSLEVLLLLNPTCLLKCVLNCERNFSFFIFRSGLTVTGLVKVYYIYNKGTIKLLILDYNCSFDKYLNSRK